MRMENLTGRRMCGLEDSGVVVVLDGSNQGAGFFSARVDGWVHTIAIGMAGIGRRSSR